MHSQKAAYVYPRATLHNKPTLLSKRVLAQSEIYYWNTYSTREFTYITMKLI